MSLPPPSPTPAQAAQWVVAPRPPLRPGMLSIGWRIATAVAWTGVLLGFAAVWRSSRTLGLGTWWLGSTSQPQPFVVQLLPTAIPLLLIVGALRNIRHLPAVGACSALMLAVVGVVDLRGFTRFGWVELALAGAGLLVSVASIAGLQRAATDRVAEEARR